MREEGFPHRISGQKGTAWASPGKGKSQREGVKLRRERSGEELTRVKRKIKRFGQKAGVHLRKNHVLDTLSESPLTEDAHVLSLHWNLSAI